MEKKTFPLQAQNSVSMVTGVRCQPRWGGKVFNLSFDKRQEESPPHPPIPFPILSTFYNMVKKSTKIIIKQFRAITPTDKGPFVGELIKLLNWLYYIYVNDKKRTLHL